jgi:hypothetical protein
MLEARHSSLRARQAFLSRPVASGGEAEEPEPRGETQFRQPEEEMPEGIRPTTSATDAAGTQGGTESGVESGVESEMEASP